MISLLAVVAPILDTCSNHQVMGQKGKAKLQDLLGVPVPETYPLCLSQRLISGHFFPKIKDVTEISPVKWTELVNAPGS